MNWDQVEGDWKTYKGKIKERWGELTNKEVDVIAGKRDQLIGQLQKRYGIAKEEAERELDDFLSKASPFNERIPNAKPPEPNRPEKSG